MSYDLGKHYEGKKVLICGASGMTGHNLYDLMKYLCADVSGTYFSERVSTQDGRSEFYQVDFTNQKETERFFYYFHDFDYVFICCAKTYNAFVCKDNPSSMILPNIQMVSNILENCLKHKIKKVLYMSSSTVYQPTNERLSESQLDLNINPPDIYLGVGWMKRYAEKLCEFYKSQGLNISVVRPTNIYGRYDKTDEKVCHVVPALVMRALNRENPYKVYGTGQAVKNFVHVDDLVRDIAIVAAKDTVNIPINLCGDEDTSIIKLVKLILAETNHHPEIRIMDTYDEIPYRSFERYRFDKMFGKQTYKPLKDGIKDVIEWYSLSHQTVKR